MSSTKTTDHIETTASDKSATPETPATPEFPPVSRAGVSKRAIGAIIFFTAVLLISRGLWAHFETAVTVVPGELEAPLDSIPTVIEDWEGVDTEIDESILYADAHLQREYTLDLAHEGAPQTLKVWIVFSTASEDRLHHPEICMAVAGQTEDKSAQAEVIIAEDKKPIQQFRFGEKGQPGQYVYYWHYTLPTETKIGEDGTGKLDALQRFYHSKHQRHASMTVEVFAAERLLRGDQPTTQELAQAFVKSLDKAIQPLLPPGSVLGSDRVDVKLVEGQEAPQQPEKEQGLE